MRKTEASALPGLAVAGFLIACPVALFPLWSYYLGARATEAALFFGFFAGGVCGGTQVIRSVPLLVVDRLLQIACAAAALALLILTLSAPAQLAVRLIGCVLAGLAVSGIHDSLFRILSSSYTRDPASTMLLGGVWFSLGSASAVAIAAGVTLLFTSSGALALLALAPAGAAVFYYRFPVTLPSGASQDPSREAWRALARPGTILFVLLLSVQSCDEWAFASWLPMFLIRRLGTSPAASLLVLVFFWLALAAGRVGTIFLLAHVRRSRLLLGGTSSALFGCFLLGSTNNLFGATVGALLVGAGFASVYPLVAERAGRRFPYYHPELFSTVFSLALAGGMLAAGVTGVLADRLGLWVMMALPAAGTLGVILILLLIWLESKVTGA